MKRIEFFMMLFNIIGALLIISVDIKLQCITFACYLIASILAIVLCLYKKMYFMLIQNVVFTIINVTALVHRIQILGA